VRLGAKRSIPGALLLGAALAVAQTGSAQRPPAAEEIFRDIQVLKGISVNEFMTAMGFFSASLGADCTFCHVPESGGNWEKYADDIPRKRTARRMVTMVSAINRDNFGGQQVITCYTCHRGGNPPKATPSLAALYSAPLLEEPNDVIAAAPGASPADEVLDKYIQALGGAERLATVTSFVARGTYQGYDDTEKHPFEVFAKAPGQRTTIVGGSDGDSTSTFDGRSAWIAGPSTARPVPVLALDGGDLAGARLDAELSFPARIKQVLSRWRPGRSTTIDDREVQVVQGTSAAGALATFFFDGQSGLLVRMVRYTDSRVGRIPTQIDYSDYREVSGVKMPFHWTVTWLDGRSIIELSDVQLNVSIDAAKFGKPAPPAPSR